MSDDLRRLVAVAAEATSHISSRVSAAKLYREAAVVAETRIPGPIGVAIAGVLHVEAHHRDVAGHVGCVGANSTLMSLALAVLELGLDDRPAQPPGATP